MSTSDDVMWQNLENALKQDRNSHLRSTINGVKNRLLDIEMVGEDADLTEEDNKALQHVQGILDRLLNRLAL